MGMWPFRRRSNRRKSASAAGGAAIPQSSEMHDAGALRDPGKHNASELTSAGPERRRSRRDTKRKSSRESKKLQRDPERRRTYSFSPGRKDSIRVPRTLDRPPVPPLPANIKGDARSNADKPDPVAAEKRPLRASTQPPEDTPTWQRMPTLHKRSAQELAHRKSSKKRKEEHQREAEIKAMVAFMPSRPATDSTASGRPMKRESKKMRGGLNRHMDNPSSDISLPLAESLRSSVSANSDHQPSYILNAFDMLAPRPTIRYAENPRYVPGASGFGSDGSESRRRRISDRVSIPKETLKANKRVDDLADDLSAGELRELMERDQKRRDRKKIAERIKMERRLARRQEKQTADEATAAREGTPPPANMERGVFGREVVGLGIGTSAVVTSSKRKGSVGSDNGRGKRPAETFRQDSTASTQSPAFHRSASLGTENHTPTSEIQDPVIETAVVGTVGRANISPTSSPRMQGHARGASSISQMMDLSKADPRPSEPIPIPAQSASRRDSRQTPTPPKAHQSWTSFFRIRGAKKHQQESAPSSFSNTSRDSMHSGGQAQTFGYTPMRSTSNIPKRTMSKFREDLPELPLSPPDSRVQSPEADMVPVPDRRIEDPRTRYDTPTSGYRSIDAMRLRDETPTSGHRTVEDPSPEPANILSQSLASIDSEGSWLSGRKAGSKRGSVQTPQHIADSSSPFGRKEFSESAEEPGIAEDEYFSRLTPGPEEQHKIRRQSAGNPMPSSDDEEGGSIASPASEKSKWGAVGRHPTVVHREPRAKSREGLLNDFDEDTASETPDTPDSPNPDNGLQRATSVDLAKKHARHMSAGSARLLDLKARPSGDHKRNSLAEEV
ncbi:hypothetical protein ONS95_014472 [Cadophora gregata]|uniref:uncharacterized protein n=1 Tax=Cadophora gregata TaxID=51156 RepID=UPI0026DB419B|nr:uncharacterized protein ONS95_014472 [Cadophora gregata]KAK0112737.1 hypothetical protein ONS95_014472 [Cadophora gregata]KAK0124872.1 hypothetical protein ONS96_008750 [Cadophora gregata f. sp. sojae]